MDACCASLASGGARRPSTSESASALRIIVSPPASSGPLEAELSHPESAPAESCSDAHGGASPGTYASRRYDVGTLSATVANVGGSTGTANVAHTEERLGRG